MGLIQTAQITAWDTGTLAKQLNTAIVEMLVGKDSNAMDQTRVRTNQVRVLH